MAYFTASVDQPADNKRFAESLQADYPILSDPEKKTAREYGVVHAGRAVPERWTFYIDKNGVIQKIDKKVKAATAGEDTVKTLKELKMIGD